MILLIAILSPELHARDSLIQDICGSGVSIPSCSIYVTESSQNKQSCLVGLI